MSEEEYMELTISVPKPVYDFYKGLSTLLRKNFEALLVQKIVEGIDRSILDSALESNIVKVYGLGKYSSISPEPLSSR